MKPRLSLIVILVATLYSSLVLSQSSNEELNLSGVAEFVQLKKSFYIAGLYGENFENDEESWLTVGNQAKRLEIRVTADSYSQRRFSMQWSQALIISATQNELLAFDQALVEFQNIIDAAFEKGDHIVIASNDSGASTIYLNDIEAFAVKRPGFLELLLSTWIGNKPPSSDFKTYLLSNSAPTDTKALYAELEPSPERIEVAAAALKTIKEPEKTKNKPVLVASAEELVKQKPKSAAKPTPVVKPAPQVVAKVATPAAQPIKKAVPKPVAIETEPEIAPEVYAKQQNTLTELYANSASRKIRSNVKYPSKAIERNQQGVAKVEVAVNRNGIIESMRLVEETKYKLLNRAALKAVEEAGKLNSIPPAIDADYVTILIPFSFKLQ